MPFHPVTPRTFDGDADPNPWSGRNFADRNAAILDRQFARGEIQAVVFDRDAERLGQVSGTATEIVLIDAAAARSAALLHQRDAAKRLQCTNQHGAGIAVRLRHRIHQVVNAVIEIDVRKTGRTKEWFASGGTAEGGMARRIVLADVRLRLDDHTGRSTLSRSMHEHFAEELFRDS